MARSVSEIWPDEAWTASAFMRVRMSVALPRLPSAICSIEPAWPVLTRAALSAPTSAATREPIAREAASSLACTMRWPEDSLASDCVACISVLSRLRCATFAA